MEVFLGIFHDFHISMVLLHKKSVQKRRW